MKRLALLFTFLSFNLHATDGVTIKATTNLSVTGTTRIAAASTNSQANCQTNAGSGNVDLRVVDPSSDGHSESGMAKIYVPILNSSASNFNCMYYELSNKPLSGQFYKPLSRGSNGATTSTDTINFPLLLDVGATAKYLYAAVKDGTDYKIVKKTSATYANLTSADISFGVSPAEICNAAPSTTACSKTTGELLEDSVTMISSPISLTVAFFLDDATYVPEDTAPTITNYTATYFQVNMSNRIYSTALPSIASVRKGDRRVTLNFSTSNQMSTSFFQKIGVYSFAAADTSNAPMGTFTTGNKIDGDFATAQSGDAVVYGLTNGTSYNLGIYLIDQFRFTSAISSSVVGLPTQIEELLKKQSCFLLTAGFGEEHYVIDYFRSFRERVLMHNYFGKVFVHYYYKYAPEFALSVYNNQTIRFFIRGMAYSLYFIFNYFGWIIAFFSIILLVHAKKRTKFLNL